jgi:hypothetical protein
VTPDAAGVLEVLRDGTVEVLGRLVASTNNALLCTATLPCPDPEPDRVATAVYKPIRGERPLDDFPDGTLGFREVAAYAVSEASGWGIVPPTVLRDGPFGPGMLQEWIDVDETVDVIGMVVSDDPALRPMAVFDAVVNNTDRKAGHILPVPGGHLYGVDHGVCFAVAPKLRTVLWGWRGKPLVDPELEVLDRLRSCLDAELAAELAPLLHPAEIAATRRRVERLLSSARFPLPDPRRPAIPWPPV